MKKFILSLNVMFLIHYSLLAQCVNEISTHPDNEPTQSHLDVLPGNSDKRFLNRWTWWFDKGSEASNSIELNNMGLNPGETYGTFMEHFNDDASQGYYFYLSKDYQEVMLPENGWELIANNRGWYPDLDTEVPMNHTTQEWTASPSLRKLPYLLFYNKFTEMARVFVRYGNNEPPEGSINIAEISIIHPDVSKMSGLLRHAEGYDRSLDQKSVIRKISSAVPSPGSASKWFSTDFKFAYDPCVCQNESAIELQFQFLTIANINLHGGAMTVPFNLVDDDNNLLDQDFLNTFDNTNGVDNGYMIYKSMEKMVDDYYQRLKVYQDELELAELHNAQVDANMAILEIAKFIFQVGGTGITAVTGMPNFTSLIGLIPALKNKEDGDTFGPKTQKAFWKELDKVLGMGFDLLIKENFTKKEEPQKLSMPTATATEMRFSGQIANSTPDMHSSVINTPGSLNANSNGINLNRPQRYPIYNEALGVFALLEKPEVKVYESVEDKNCTFFQEEHLAYAELRFDHVFQFSIKDDLKYVFNQVLSIEKYDIEASFDIHASRKEGSQFDTINGEPWKLRNNHSKAVNVESISYSIDKPMDTIPDSVIVHSTFVPLDAFNNFTGGFANHYVFGQYGVGSGEMFCDGLESTELEHFPHLGIDSVYLKLLINVTYEGEKSDGSPHEYTYILTYKIDEDDIDWDLNNPIYPNLPGSAGDITQYPEYLSLTGANFNGSAVEGCVLNGTTYTCKAWGDIDVTGEYTVANNYVVNIVAGNEVNLEPEADYPSEMNFMIGIFDFSNPMPPQTPTQVGTFCNSNNGYQANEAKNGMFIDNDETEKERILLEPEYKFNYNLYPNPASGNVTVALTYPKGAYTDLYVTNLSGQRVLTGISNGYLNEGEHTHSLATESLAPGIYLVTLVMNGEPKVKRLVKQ